MENPERRYVSLLETAMCSTKGVENSESSNTESNCSSGSSSRSKRARKWSKKKQRRHSAMFKELESTPLRLSGRLYPLNHTEQKERFLRYGLAPDFNLRVIRSRRKELSIMRRAAIRFEHFDDACRILDAVRDRFGDGSAYLYEAFGPRISRDQASRILADYIRENNLDRKMTIYWTPELTCSARMMWRGPHRKTLRPEDRRYTLIIKNSFENQYLRQKAVRCLADHEIGTHFFRMYNEGFQPWYRDRARFDLRGTTTRQYFATEEGLAAINTVLNANFKYLWLPAILYYTACRATQLTFKELYDDLEQYITDAEQRWKHVMRVKRYLTDSNGLGGYGGDQCYLEGALKLLRNVETLDWAALYCGEICVDEVQRVHRIARRDIVSLPTFLADVDKYRKQLRQIAVINGLNPEYTLRSPVATHIELNAGLPPTRSRSQRKPSAAPTRNAPRPRNPKCTNHHQVTLAPVTLPVSVPAGRTASTTERVEKLLCGGKDRLRVEGSAVTMQEAACDFRLASAPTAAKRLATLHKQCQQSVSTDNIDLVLKRLHFLRRT